MWDQLRYLDAKIELEMSDAVSLAIAQQLNGGDAKVKQLRRKLAKRAYPYG